VREFAQVEVVELVTSLMAGSPIAVVVANAVGDTVAALLASPALVNGLLTVIGTALPALLGHSEFVGAVAEVAGHLAGAVIAGADLSQVLANALADLQANASVTSALKSTIAATLSAVDTALLSNAAVQQLLGQSITELIVQLAADSGFRTYVGNLIGEPWNQTVEMLLADSTVITDLATVLGTAVGDFLSYPGFNGALTAMLGQVADAVLDGGEMTAASITALAWLQADADFQAAVNAVVPAVVAAILGNEAVRHAISSAARDIVVALLRGAGITSDLLAGVAGQMIKSATAFLTAQRSVAHLLDTIVQSILTGAVQLTVDDIVLKLLLPAVLETPDLQYAVGMALGVGVGSVFGDNLVGLLVSGTVGVSATVLISIAAGIARVVMALQQAYTAAQSFPAPPAAAAHPNGHFFEQISVSSDLVVMNAIVPNWSDSAVIRPANAVANNLVLTAINMDASAPGNALAVNLMVDYQASDTSSHPLAPMLLNFMFPLDRLFPGTPIGPVALAESRIHQHVS
jgi:hypothetical protein